MSDEKTVVKNVSVAVSPDFHGKLKEIAEAEGVSIGTVLKSIADDVLAARYKDALSARMRKLEGLLGDLS